MRISDWSSDVCSSDLAIDVARLAARARRCRALLARHPDAPADDRLVAYGRDRPQQLDEMRAALRPADPLLHLPCPAWPDLETLQLHEVGRNVAAAPIRPRVGHRLEDRKSTRLNSSH